MEGFHRFLQSQKEIQSLIDGVEAGMQEQFIAGLSGTTRGLLVSVLSESLHRPILLMTNQLFQAQQLYEDLLQFSNEDHVYLYPANELIATEIAVASPELMSERIDSLTGWLSKDAGIMVAPVSAAKRILPPKSYWEETKLYFKVGEEIPLEQYLRSIVQMGYMNTSMVTRPGEFSRRGGIIDIYPMTEAGPVRFELFDNEVDSIRYFDADTQRSLDKIEEITIYPANESLLSDTDMVNIADRLEKALATSVKHLTKQEDKEHLVETIEQDIEQFRQASAFEGMHKYIELFYEQPMSLLDYLPDDGLLILDEMNRIQETATQLDKEEAEWYSRLLADNEIVKDVSFSFDWVDVRSKMRQQRIYTSVFLKHIANTAPENIVNLSSRDMQEFHGQMHLLQNEMDRWQKADFSVLIFVPNDERAKKVQSVLADYDMKAVIKDELELPTKEPTIIVGSVQSGFELSAYKLVVITEKELFKKQQARKRKRQTLSNAERIKSYQELKIGDYVVHESHGIGKYIGVETVKVANMHKDYMLIKYSGDDKLYVPIDQIDLVQKFVGSEGKEPRLYKLGGTEWKRVKSRVQSSVEDIADELIKLYAEREARKGFAFSEDTSLQRDFEASFAYQETDDQLRCIEEIKKDMERERPMDRLLCGDVGYGKTEVAIRAAFKAITDGKQVAILVPTTILAQQHYQTIQERFRDQAINIGLLSRFRTQKQMKETLDDLKKGSVDVIIGTHRLLSKDVVFQDLGLLIVDEEQRFGVKHKERIKQIKTNVDVLTLTATPIPRTLHMSMVGVRDLSVIETPPENRFPVQTYVLEYNHAFIKEAIEREMARNGQVYFLYNRVDNIDKVAGEIRSLVEDSRVAVAHGQMNESELEDIMFGFLEGEYDVLVSTTIIETGVDIPNVNTLIVHDADHMGLSQLYQLRGRVGRSNRIAYAYFTYQKDKILTEVAEKRLQAIKEFTELGSGFKIAMRDLSIRGAGNLLGAQQHGFIDSVGFDMYSQMLKEAIDARKLDIENEPQVKEPVLNLLVDAYIPETYIQDEKQKIDMYKYVQSIRSEEELLELQDELIDRFGDYPKEVAALLKAAELKLHALAEEVETIDEEKNRLTLLLSEPRSLRIDGAKLFELVSGLGNNIQLGTSNNQLKIIFKWKNNKQVSRYDEAIDLLKQLGTVNREEQVTE